MSCYTTPRLRNGPRPGRDTRSAISFAEQSRSLIETHRGLTGHRGGAAQSAAPQPRAQHPWRELQAQGQASDRTSDVTPAAHINRRGETNGKVNDKIGPYPNWRKWRYCELTLTASWLPEISSIFFRNFRACPGYPVHSRILGAPSFWIGWFGILPRRWTKVSLHWGYAPAGPEILC